MRRQIGLPYDPGGTENDGDDEDDFSIFFGICNISKPSKASSEQPTITRKIKPCDFYTDEVPSHEYKDNCLLFGICNSSSKKLMSTKKSLSREAKSGSRNGC